jgi:hypothetical protein
MKSTNPGTRRRSASSFPVLSLLVAMKMNGPAIELPPSIFRHGYVAHATIIGA